MDCKPESAARTFIRMLLLAVQGLGMALFLFLCGIALAPFTPFYFTFLDLKARKGWAKWVLIPLWFLHGTAYSILSPFQVFFKTLKVTAGLVILEWTERWMAASPKDPVGNPIA